MHGWMDGWMEGWILFWKVALYSGVGLFSVMSVWVTIAGYGDIKKMFVELRRQQECKSDRDLS